MKEWLVDTNVLLDVIGADPVYGQASKRALAECGDSGVLIINPVIYAEMGVLVDTV